jgi:hypothetical protein
MDCRFCGARGVMSRAGSTILMRQSCTGLYASTAKRGNDSFPLWGCDTQECKILPRYRFWRSGERQIISFSID